MWYVAVCCRSINGNTNTETEPVAGLFQFVREFDTVSCRIIERSGISGFVEFMEYAAFCCRGINRNRNTETEPVVLFSVDGDPIFFPGRVRARRTLWYRISFP